jgi:hypothetical protein
VPEISEDGLLGGEHVVFLLVLKAPTQVSFLIPIIAPLPGLLAITDGVDDFHRFEYCLSSAVL